MEVYNKTERCVNGSQTYQSCIATLNVVEETAKIINDLKNSNANALTSENTEKLDDQLDNLLSSFRDGT
jgi:hypothetical protein